MRSGLLNGGVSTVSTGHASGGSASSGPAGSRVFSAERESLRTQAQTRDTVGHVLLQRIEETHCQRRCV